MSSLSLYFVRHAPVIGQDGIAYGRDALIDEECHDLFNRAAALLPHNCDIWITSEFPRAQRTAALLQDRLGIHQAPVIDGSFNEQDFGTLVGRNKKDIAADPANRAYLADMTIVAPPGGESVPQMVHRVGIALQTLSQTLQDAGKEQAIIVCHGGIIRAVDSLVHGHPFKLDLKVPHLSVHKFGLSALSL